MSKKGKLKYSNFFFLLTENRKLSAYGPHRHYYLF